MTGLQHDVGAAFTAARLQRGGEVLCNDVFIVGANLRVCPFAGVLGHCPNHGGANPPSPMFPRVYSPSTSASDKPVISQTVPL